MKRPLAPRPTLVISLERGKQRLRVRDSVAGLNKNVLTPRGGARLPSRIWVNACGQVHREGGPAIEHDNGGKEWYSKGYQRKFCFVS